MCIRDRGSEEMLARIPVWRADLGLAHKAYLSAIAYDLSLIHLFSITKNRARAGVAPLTNALIANVWDAGYWDHAKMCIRDRIIPVFKYSIHSSSGVMAT